MKKLYYFIILMLMPVSVWAADAVAVPWDEIKMLYKESITQEVLKNAQKEKVPFVYTINEAAYQLAVGEVAAHGKLTLQGEVISGEAHPIPLFNNQMIIRNVAQSSGGSLLWGKKDGGRIVFLPDGSRNFEIGLSFVVPIQEDRRSKLISFDIPRALKNTFDLELPPENRLLDHPGIRTADRLYLFAACSTLTVRFSDKKELKAAPAVAVDSLSRITFQAHRAFIVTEFIPIQSLPQTVIVAMPESATFVSSNLKKSWIEMTTSGSLHIHFPVDYRRAFTITVAHAKQQDGRNFSFSLPIIAGNTGKQGNFIVDEPEDAQVLVSGARLTQRIPVSTLPSDLMAAAGADRFYLRIADGEKINLAIKPFSYVDTAPVVLDTISFFTAFEENGGSLSVLILDVPPEAGQRLSITSVPDAEIWYLKVNGKKTRAYVDQQDIAGASGNGKWIVPLAVGEPSHVELAFNLQKQKLGLYGQLETVLPGINLPSRRVQVGIALPKRLQLLSLDGPVSPAPQSNWKTPIEFIGKPFFFTRSFFKGGQMKMAISYKEPVK